MSTQTKIIIVVVIVIALLAGAYLLFFNTSGSTSALTASNSAPASAAEVTFLNLSTQAEAISFNTSIFSNPLFTTLVDTQTTVIPVPEGRSDPFAALPGDASSN